MKKTVEKVKKAAKTAKKAVKKTVKKAVAPIKLTTRQRVAARRNNK